MNSERNLRNIFGHAIRAAAITCRSYTDTGPPFLYGDSDTPPHLVAFYDTLGICILDLNPPASSRGSKISQPIRVQGGNLCWRIGPRNTNFVEHIEILLPVKFRQNLFSGCRGEVENLSANQKPGRPSMSNLVEDVEILIPVKFCQNPFRGEVEIVSQSDARTAIFVDGSARKTQTW